MNFLKTFFSFIMGTICFVLISRLFNFPPIPAFPIYVYSTLCFEKFKCTNIPIYIVFLILLGMFGLGVWGFGIYMLISNYPEYGNWIRIILETISFFAILGAVKLNLIVAITELKNK